MERPKRKSAATPLQEGGTPKRMKTLTLTSTASSEQNANDADEDAETIADVGAKFCDYMRSAKDKNGRPIAEQFLTLPSRRDIPEYYQAILLPIAIDTIENKTKRKEYRDISAMESDAKRMVQNAKEFNLPKSEIYEDAERLRKIIYNFMKDHNHAYRENKNYVAQPTPVPEVSLKISMRRPKPVEEPEEEEPEPKPTKAERRKSRSAFQVEEEPQGTKSTKSAKNTKNAETEPEDDGPSFVGKSFQEAQEQIINELVNYEDKESGLKIYTPFVTLPSRELADYYRLIRYPMSLNGVMKRVKGVHGRKETTGVTDFSTWDAFEAEAARIWQNARHYNEDQSEIWLLAGELEAHFKRRLASAKRYVDAPSQPKIKLNIGGVQPETLKLRLGGQKESPVAAASPSAPGVSVDELALQRQKRAVQDSIKDAKSPATAEETSQAPAAAQSKSPPAVNGIVKTETESLAGGTPAPPTQTAPAPLQSAAPLTNGIATPGSQLQQLNTASQARYHPPPSSLDPKFRPEGKTIADALLTNISITTHPDINVPAPFSYTLPPDPALSHQSITLNLPMTHHTLRLEPKISPSLSAQINPPSPGRPHRIFVSANGVRIPHTGGIGSWRLVYDCKLVQGVNRIDVECVAVAAPPPRPSRGERSESARETRYGGLTGEVALDSERVTLFVQLLRM